MSVCPSVRLSVYLLQTLLLIFVSRWNGAIVWTSVLHDKNYKALFFDFRFRPPNTQNLLPQICTKIGYKSACMADRPEMFGPTIGFSGMADSMEPCKMLWADPCCHGNEIWARRGDLVAYRLVLFNCLILT